MTINAAHLSEASCITKTCALLAALLLLAAALPTQAQILWYNGDFNNRGGLISSDSDTTTYGADGIVYEDFIVTSPNGWRVTDAFENFLYSTTASKIPEDAVTPTANWEIRSGISSGDGGTLIASGNSSITPVQFGTYTSTTNFTYNLDTVTISGLNVVLDPGTYWLAIQPVATAGGAFSFTTSGTNSIGLPAGDDGNSFFSSISTGQNFEPTSDTSAGGTDFSLGVKGIVLIPEPSAWALVFIGIAGLVAIRIRATAHRAQPVTVRRSSRQK